MNSAFEKMSGRDSTSPCVQAKPRHGLALLLLALVAASQAEAGIDADVYLTDVPDYDWFAGCFGTATGNLFGYWDRHGLPNFYTGPTNKGLAPLNDRGTNVGIRSMWASEAGLDGRPASQPGHVDDYWHSYVSDFDYSYESTAPDPYRQFGRAEHPADCIGDFIGLSQNKWTNMNGECDGNVDAYSFVYWDLTGHRRTNFTPPPEAGLPAVDIQSGLRAWSRYRGYEADVFTQLVDFNPKTPPGEGFTFADLKAEIDAGYPVLVFLQTYSENSRRLSEPIDMARANPDIHAMLIYGYAEDSVGPLVRVRTSWASGDNVFYDWNATPWVNFSPSALSVRGVIGCHPKPKIIQVTQASGKLTLQWEGPSSQLYDELDGSTKTVHQYIVERTDRLDSPNFVPVTEPTAALTATVSECCGSSGFYRVRLADSR